MSLPSKEVLIRKIKWDTFFYNIHNLVGVLFISSLLIFSFRKYQLDEFDFTYALTTFLIMLGTYFYISFGSKRILEHKRSNIYTLENYEEMKKLMEKLKNELERSVRKEQNTKN